VALQNASHVLISHLLVAITTSFWEELAVLLGWVDWARADSANACCATFLELLPSTKASGSYSNAP
jgi:hypothetical protein